MKRLIAAALLASSATVLVTVPAGAGEITGKLMAIKRAGLEGLRIHDLRHTAVAMWIEAGATPADIARRAGHSSVSVVLDHYRRLMPGSEDRVTEALDNMVRQALP